MPPAQGDGDFGTLVIGRLDRYTVARVTNRSGCDRA